MSRFRLAILLLVPAAATLFLTTRFMNVRATPTPAGDTVYAYGPVVPISTAVAAAFTFASAVLIASARIAWLRLFALLPLGLALLLTGAAVSVARDYASVGPGHLVLPARGFPWREHRRISLNELDRVTITRDEAIRFDLRDRTSITVPLGDLTRAARPQIDQALAARGVLVIETP
jgi:hypothetical protein